MFKKVCIVSLMTLALTGCQSMGPNETSGTWIGGIAGTIIGAHFGSGSGHFVGAAIGAAAGALTGNFVGRNMDD